MKSYSNARTLLASFGINCTVQNENSIDEIESYFIWQIVQIKYKGVRLS